MTPPLGLVEGRFGRPFTWTERTDLMRRLAPMGYSFYHYAPKADRHLRRDWRAPHPLEEFERMAAFAKRCRRENVRFGIGLTPMGLAFPLDPDDRRALIRRIGELDAIGIDDLLVLFDDLRGDVPALARRQAEIVTICADATRARRVFTCPTYYSDDPMLDAAFGRRPARYLNDFGRLLDPKIAVYWTGEEVCAREIGAAHLDRVAGELGRRVCLWDNYPVNDGPRMSRFLHLRAFVGRPATIAGHLAAHAINPALQPVLTTIPALTLAMSYRRGDRYAYAAAFAEAALAVLGRELGQAVVDDLAALQDVGHERLGDRRDELTARYARFDHPGAREIVGWLAGTDLMTGDEVRTQ